MGSAMPAWVQTALAIASWGLVIGAWVLIAVWARGKRGAGVRWCAKCLYDMTGLPGMRCPECGREEKSERQLRRRKRRWWALVVALVLFVLNYAMWVPGRVQSEGWKTALVPTGALVVGLPWVVESQSTRYSGLPRSGSTLVLWDSLADCLEERVWGAKLSAWHWEVIGQMGLRSDVHTLVDDEFHVSCSWQILLRTGLTRNQFRDGLCKQIRNIALIDVQTRAKWPQRSQVTVLLNVRRWDGQRKDGVTLRIADRRGRVLAEIPSDDLNGPRMNVAAGYVMPPPSCHAVLGDPPRPGETAEYTAYLVRRDDDGNPGEPFATTRFEVSGVGVESDKFLVPDKTVESDIMLDVLARPLSSLMSQEFRELWYPRMNVELGPSGDELVGNQLTIALRFDLYRGDINQYKGTMLITAHRVDGLWRGAMRASMEPVGEERVGEEEPWRLVIRSDPTLALLNFGCDRYWEGQGEWLLPVEKDGKEE